MEIQPVFAALHKHKIPATLIVLEIALACAVLCNAVFMIGQRMNEMRLPNAIDQGGIITVSVQGANPKLAAADVPRNLAALRGIPGVKAAAAINAIPLGYNSWNSVMATDPGKLMSAGTPNAATYLMSAGAPSALDLRLLKGRLFNAAEYAEGKLAGSFAPTGHVVILTQHLARRLWPGGGALGKQVWLGKNNAYTVVGIVANVLRPNAAGGGGLDNLYNSAFFPVSPIAALTDYVVRTAPRNRRRALAESVEKMETLAPNAVVKGRTFSAIRSKYFAATRSMVWMLAQVCLVMLVVTAFSIVGLTSFWVGQRRRQIGIRRALGATRGQITRYFQTENFLLSTADVVLGMILSYGANLYLMQHYQLDRMPWYYLPISAAALWLLGQLAVLGPALRASLVPPVVATRNV
ncbi:MAG TPA: FtsX-like permease family protein [Rhodanobacteraceae bacterium]